MPETAWPSYNCAMSTTAPDATSHFAAAGLLLDALAAHDFARVAAALDTDATLSALLPRGFREWAGADAIAGAFETWFGDVDDFEVADASVGQVGALLQMRWRLRVGGGRFGAAQMVIEQHVYAATGKGGRIEKMSLLCSGFWPEHVND